MHREESRMERIDVIDVTLERVDKLCYLGDTTGSGGGAEASNEKVVAENCYYC